MLYAGVTIVILIIILLFVPVIWIKIGGFLPGAGLAALAQKKASDFNKTMIYRR